MFSLETVIHVDGLTARAVTDFLSNCTDADYQAWWPDVHLRFHIVKSVEGDVGNIYFMDEYIGNHRVRMKGVVVEAEPGRKIVWQMQRIIRLPVIVNLTFADEAGGVKIDHRIDAGFSGVGAVFDPLFRLHFTKNFAAALDAHVKEEFPRLRDLLAARAAAG